MAIAFVQKVVKDTGGATGTTLSTGAPASSTTAGNLLVILLAIGSSGRTGGVPTDSAGNVYHLAAAYENGSLGDYIYYCFNAAAISSSGGSWTCTTDGTSSDIGITVLEYSGLGAGSLGTTGNAGNGSGSGTSQSVSTTGSAIGGDLVIGMMGSWGHGTGAVSATGFTMREDGTSFSFNSETAGGDILAATAGVQTFAATWTNSVFAFGTVIACFTVAGGAPAPATKIAFVNAGAQAAANSTPQTPALPTNHASGDLLLMFCSQASASGITFSPPAGWTSIARNNNATRSMTIEVYAKIDNGSESNPSVGVSSAAAGWTVQIGAWRYVDEAVIEDAADVSSDAAAAATFQPTGITTNTANAWVLSYVCSKDDNALNYNNQNGYSDRMSGANYDTTLGNGSDQAIGVADKEFASTGAQTCPTWNQSTNGNDAWVALTIALRPKTLVWGGRGPGFIGQIQMQQLLAT